MELHVDSPLRDLTVLGTSRNNLAVRQCDHTQKRGARAVSSTASLGGNHLAQSGFKIAFVHVSLSEERRWRTFQRPGLRLFASILGTDNQFDVGISPIDFAQRPAQGYSIIEVEKR